MSLTPPIVFSEEERTTLLLWSRLPAAGRLARRAQMILMAAEGKANQTIAQHLGTPIKTVALWRQRFLAGRLAGIEKESPRGKPQAETHSVITLQIIEKTATPPPDNATRWTTRSLAQELGVSPSMVHRVWKAEGLSPPRT